MPTVTIVYGLLLIALGVVSYVATDMVSMTALIPAFFGLPVLIAGVVARNEARLKLAMHIAATIGLLGFLGTVKSLAKIPALLNGEELARPEAVRAQVIMAVLSLVFVVLCVKSFIDVRRARKKLT